MCSRRATSHSTLADADTPPFGTVIGVVPTHDGAVAEVYDALRTLRGGLVPLVDGDDAGVEKIDQVHGSDPMPELILRWRDGWTLEDAIGWILEGDEGAALAELQGRIDREFESIDELGRFVQGQRLVLAA